MESVDEREPEDYIKDFKDAQEHLSLSYEQICEEYRLRLCNQFGIDWHDTYWIIYRIGDLLDVNCYYVIDMDSLKFVVDSGMTFDEFDEWYTKQLEK